jgi:hypothetical protein
MSSTVLAVLVGGPILFFGLLTAGLLFVAAMSRSRQRVTQVARVAPPSGMLSERVRAFMTAGDVAAAIALVRAETGMTQAEAERFVDALDE